MREACQEEEVATAAEDRLVVMVAKQDMACGAGKGEPVGLVAEARAA